MNFKKSISLVFPFSMALVMLSSCNGGVNFVERTVDLYAIKAEHKTQQKLYFSSSYPGIPFIDLNDGLSLLKSINEGSHGYKLSSKIAGSTYTFERENGSKLSFDFKNNIVECSNVNAFTASTFAKTSLDERTNDESFYNAEGKKIEGYVRFISNKKTNEAFETKYDPLRIYLNDYNIKTFRQNDKYLVPFTTFYNIAGYTGVACIFNGESLFFVSASFADPKLEKIFYSFPKQARSKELKEYNYNELCRQLDYTYGLKEEHGIASFNDYMNKNGLKDLLMSDSSYDADKAYYELEYSYLADFHTGYSIPNAYGGKRSPEEREKIVSEIKVNPALVQKDARRRTLKTNRTKYKNIDESGTVISPIIKTDDTLLITFDSFKMNDKGCDFYYTDTEFRTNKEAYVKNNPSDTVALISYANDLIHEDLKLANPTIKNVAIDLTANGGGIADVAMFVLGWFDSSQMNLNDPISNYYSSVSYQADINFDGKVDGNDLLVFADSEEKAEWEKESGYKAYDGKVYCIASEMSFSCGNYVPAMLKQTGLVKLVGSKTGGGACIVRVGNTADGSGLCFSSNKKLCTIINGSFYSIDQGIEPDYPLNDLDTLYGGDQEATVTSSNRKNLIDYLKSLK